MFDDFHIWVELLDTDLLDDDFGSSDHQVALGELACFPDDVEELPEENRSFRGVCQKRIRFVTIPYVRDDIENL